MFFYFCSLLFALCVLCLLSVFVSMRCLLVIVTLYMFCANRGFLECELLVHLIKIYKTAGVFLTGIHLLTTQCCQRLLQYKFVSRVFGQPSMQHQQTSPVSSHERANTETSVQQDTLEVGGVSTKHYKIKFLCMYSIIVLYSIYKKFGQGLNFGGF